MLLYVVSTYIIPGFWVKQTGIGCPSCYPHCLVTGNIADPRYGGQKIVQFVSEFPINGPDLHSLIKRPCHQPLTEVQANQQDQTSTQNSFKQVCFLVEKVFAYYIGYTANLIITIS